MGLDTSHDCFHGSYSAFNRLRKAVARACGGSFPPHMSDYDAAFLASAKDVNDRWWYYDDDTVPINLHVGARLFLSHSDCDGTLTPDESREVAAFLRWVAPRVEIEGEGHLSSLGTRGAVERFAAGCEAASEAGETVKFA